VNILKRSKSANLSVIRKSTAKRFSDSIAKNDININNLSIKNPSNKDGKDSDLND
jgi:hypothetical protein